jgi:hypothetical protein
MPAIPAQRAAARLDRGAEPEHDYTVIDGGTAFVGIHATASEDPGGGARRLLAGKFPITPLSNL